MGSELSGPGSADDIITLMAIFSDIFSDALAKLREFVNSINNFGSRQRLDNCKFWFVDLTVDY